MELDVESEPFGCVRQLHGRGNPHVLHVAAHEVGGSIHHEVDAGFESANVFGDEERGVDGFPQFAVRELRYSPVRQRVFVPEVSCFVARAPHFQRAAKGLERVVGIRHQIHIVPDTVSHCKNRLDLTTRLAVLPPVDLEGWVAQFLALLREVRHFAWRSQLTALRGVNAGRIGWQSLAVSSEESMNRRVVVLPCQIPEGDVNGGESDLRLLAHRMLDLRVDVLALQRVASEEEFCYSAGSDVFDLPAPHILSAYADVGEYRHGVGCVGDGLAGRKDHPLRTAVEVWQVVAERFDFDPRNSGRLHRRSFFCIAVRRICCFRTAGVFA